MPDENLIQNYKNALRNFRAVTLNYAKDKIRIKDERSLKIDRAKKELKADEDVAFSQVSKVQRADKDTREVLGHIGLQNLLGNTSTGSGIEVTLTGNPKDELNKNVMIVMGEASAINELTLELQKLHKHKNDARIFRKILITFMFLCILIISYFLISWRIKEGLYFSANQSLASQDFSGAQSDFEKLIRFDSDYKDTQALYRTSYYLEVVSLMQAQSWSEARDPLQKLISIEPGYLDVTSLLCETYYQEALSFMNNKEWFNAQTALEDIYSIDKNYKDANDLLKESYYQEALGLYQSSEWEKASRVFKILMSMSPDYKDCTSLLVDAYYQVALISIEDKQWEKAGSMIDAILKIDPANLYAIEAWNQYPGVQIALADLYDEYWVVKLNSGKTLNELTTQSIGDLKYKVIFAGFSLEGSKFISVSDARQIKIFDLMNSSIYEFEVEGYRGLGSAAYSPQSNLLAYAGSDDNGYPRMTIWDLTSDKKITLDNELQFRSTILGFSGAGDELIVHQDDTIIVYNSRTLTEVRKFDIPDYYFSNRIMITPDGSQVVINWDNRIEFWNNSNGTKEATIPTKYGIFSLTGNKLAYYSNGKSIIYDLKTKQPLYTIPGGEEGNKIYLSSGGNIVALVSDIAILGNYGSINFIFHSQENAKMFEGQQVEFVVFSPMGNYMAIGYKEDFARTDKIHIFALNK